MEGKLDWEKRLQLSSNRSRIRHSMPNDFRAILGAFANIIILKRDYLTPDQLSQIRVPMLIIQVSAKLLYQDIQLFNIFLGRRQSILNCSNGA